MDNNTGKISQKEIVDRAEENTIKKFFTSSEFHSALEAILVSSIDKRLGKSYSLDLKWTAKNGPVAYTDGTKVFINLNNFITDTFKNLPYKSLSYKGLLAHELGHILFSNFQLLRDYNESFMNGKILNESSISYKNMEELKEILSNNKHSLERKIIASFAGNINNLLEDIYIEARLVEEFPGALKTGLIINNERLGATSPSIDKQLKQKMPKVFVVINGLIKALKAQSNTFGEDEEIRNYLTELSPICKSFCYSTNPNTRVNGATYVVLEILPLIKDFIEEAKKQQQEQKSSKSSKSTGSSSDGSGISSGFSGSSNSGEDSENSDSSDSSNSSDSTDNSQNSSSSNSDSENKDNGESKKSSQSNADEDSKDKEDSNSSNNSTGKEVDKEGKENKSNSEKDTKKGNSSSNSKSEDNKEKSAGTSKDNSKLSPEEEKELEEQLKKAIKENLKQKTVQPKGYNKPEKVSPKNNDSVNENAMRNAMENLKIDDSFSSATKVTGKSKVTFNKNYVGGEYDREEARLKKTLYEKAKNELVKEKENEFTSSLIDMGNNTHLKGIHSGIHIKINRQERNLPSKADYDDYLILHDIKRIVKSARKDLDKVLKAEAYEDELQKLYAGNKFCIKNAYRPDKRVFSKTHQPMEQKNLTVSILVDDSGSMEGQRTEMARRAAIMLYEFCKAENVPITIIGHTAWDMDSISLYSYADAESFDNKDCQRLLTISAKAANRDGAAIRFACERLYQRPEEKKLFIIISDGQPAAWGYYGEEAYKDLNSIKREYERKGIEFVAAAIGDDKEQIKKIYGKNYLDVDNLEKLPKNLSKIISRKILE